MQHFKNDATLSKKLEDLLETLKEEHMLTPEEKTAVLELCHIYETQKDTVEELSPIMKLKLTKDIPHLVSYPSDVHSKLLLRIYTQYCKRIFFFQARIWS